MMHRLRLYYQLTKPGIIRGNLFATTAGYFLAAKGHLSASLLAVTLLGTALVIAAGCVYNNYLDRGIDKHMQRTKKRALVRGDISGRAALVFGTVLALMGAVTLAVWVNWLTLALGILGLFFYVVVYGVAKRRTVWGTVIGSIAGALPPAAGYTAANNAFDTGAVLLFVAMACWQVPHFYAIAMFRYDEYAAAGLPVLPVVKGMRAAKLQVLAFIAAFIAAALLLTAFGYTGAIYTATVSIFGSIWLLKGWAGFKSKADVAWARGMFFFSLSVLMVFCLGIIFDSLLL